MSGTKTGIEFVLDLYCATASKNCQTVTVCPELYPYTVELYSSYGQSIEKINPDILNLNYLTPYPGTALFELAQRESLLLKQDWSEYTAHDIVMNTKSLSEDYLLKIRDRIIRELSWKKLGGLVLSLGYEGVKIPNFYFNEARFLLNEIVSPKAN